MASKALLERATLLHHVDRTDDVRAEQFTAALLRLADREQIDSLVFAMALADALAVTAATLDQQVSKQQFADRLHVFCDRAAKKYIQVSALMARKQWSPHGEG